MVQRCILTCVLILIEETAGAVILSAITCVTFGATLRAVLATCVRIRSHLYFRYNVELTSWALVYTLVAELRENEFSVQ
jgi:hypothetical protein